MKSTDTSVKEREVNLEDAGGGNKKNKQWLRFGATSLLIAIGMGANTGGEKLGSDATILVGDLFEMHADVFEEFDVVVNAFANHKDAYLNLDALTHLLHEFRRLQTRIIFILGAASLVQANGTRLFDFLKELPGNEAWIDEPRYGVLELEILRATPDVFWTGVSPQQNFVPGPATAHRTAKDDLLLAEDGKSHVTAGNMAVGILDEIETPKHVRERFTVSDL